MPNPLSIPDLLAVGIDGASAISNYMQQEKNLKYMKGVQQTTWDREDNAVQRRVADLTKAGLSPVLAAGSAAATSAPINVGTPQINFGAMDKASAINSNAATRQSIEQAKEQTNLIKNQENATNNAALRDYTQSELNRVAAEKGRIDTEKSMADRNNAYLNNQILQRDFDIAKEQGVRFDLKSGSTTNALNAVQAITEAVRKLRTSSSSADHAAIGQLNKVQGDINGFQKTGRIQK